MSLGIALLAWLAISVVVALLIGIAIRCVRGEEGARRPVKRRLGLGGVALLVAGSLLPSIGETGSGTLADGVRRMSSIRTAMTTPTTTTSYTTTTTTPTTSTPTSSTTSTTTAPSTTTSTTSDLLARAHAAFESAVPPGLRAIFPAKLEIVSGSTSLSGPDGRIQMSEFHAGGQWSHLRAVIAHEWGHQTAFRQGSQAYPGAPPDGWPYDGPHPEEAWADCVAVSLTGINPSGDTAECTGPTIQFVDDWLASR